MDTDHRDTDYRHRAAPTDYFFTVSLESDHYGALTEHVDTLRLAFRACRDRYPFTMVAGVVLPDHLHCILTLPPADTARAARWRLIKGLFERVVHGGRSVWKPDFDEHCIDDEAELSRQVDDLHADPVRHGLVRLPRNWPYSSFHAYVAQGLRPPYWCPDSDSRGASRLPLQAA